MIELTVTGSIDNPAATPEVLERIAAVVRSAQSAPMKRRLRGTVQSTDEHGARTATGYDVTVSTRP